LIDRIQIATAGNAHYLPGAIGTLASLRMAIEPEVALEVAFLHDGLAEPLQQRLRNALARIRGVTSLHFVRIEADFTAYPDFFFPSKLTYARLLLPNQPLEGRILYLDSDILVLKNPESLLTRDFGLCGISAAVEATIRTIAGDPPRIDPGFSVDREAPYFNAGFLVLDLDRIRNNGLFRRASELLATRSGACAIYDQSALNFVANGSFDRIDQNWNTQIHRQCFDPVAAMDSLAARSINVHFVTKAKPWLSWNPFPADEMFRILLDRVDSGWRTAEYERRAARTRRKYRLAGAHTTFFRLRALAKKSAFQNPKSDLATAKFWRQAAEDYRALRRRSREFDALLQGWRQEIASKLS
jgi:lipopolysaccharide biosynthesis glycosyltransferase